MFLEESSTEERRMKMPRPKPLRTCQARCEYVDCERRKINRFIYPDGDGSLRERNFSCPSCNRIMLATRKVGIVSVGFIIERVIE